MHSVRYPFLLITVGVAVTATIAPHTAQAVLVLGGRDASGNLDNSGRNLSPAPFSLDNYEGEFANFLGTPIAPHYFVTAAHIGGGIGQQLSLDGVNYTTVATQTQNDLAVWETDPNGPAFPTSQIAPLYTASTEVGNTMVVIGRGGPRGSTVTVNGTDRGYLWVPQDQAAPYSWAQQTVTSIEEDDNHAQYVAFSFARQTDGNGTLLNPDQGGVSYGDSGGAVFVRDPADNVFKLAGITYGADGAFNVNAVSSADYKSSDAFTAGLYDASGLYYDGTDTQIPSDGTAQPTDSYASRIEYHLDFIDGVTGLPEPTVGLMLLGLPVVLGRGGRNRKRSDLPERGRGRLPH